MNFVRLFLVFLLLLIMLQLSSATFSLLKWFKGIFHVKNSTKPIMIDNGRTIAMNTSSNDINSEAMVKQDVKRHGSEIYETEFWDANQIPATCNEDAILLPLARLKIISPEKIIELLATPSLEYTCERVNKTIYQIHEGIAACPGFPESHLYKKLCDGLEYFSQKVCTDVSYELKRRHKSKNALIRHWDCYSQLLDDLFDCEGPPDWFEKKNKSAACQFYNDVIDCNYIKAAMLCGKEAAKVLRGFSDGVFRRVLTFPCKISHPAPHVDVSMLGRSYRLHKYRALNAFGLYILYILA